MQEGKLEEHLKANMNSYLPLRDIVFFTLREAILMGDLEPGERLLEISLADKLGVSRTPVREAIRKLELEGLVLMLPRRGAEVASISGKNLRDVLEVRRGLEALTVELVVDHITAEQIAELDEANYHFESLLGGKNLTAIAEADEHFHELIYKASGNEKLVQVIGNIRDQIYRFRLEYIKDKNKRMGLAGEHDRIVRALEARDMAKAKELMAAHIMKQEQTIIANLKLSQD